VTTTPPWQRVKEIFAGATDCAPEERDAFVARESQGDEELQREVQSLLNSHDATGDFIETPAAHRALGMEDYAPTWIGRRLGFYRIVDEIGRGGMSEVYRAVRDDDDYNKEVAIKVLRRGYDIDSLLRRFRVEKQILANLDHPNIARLLDGGTSPEGLPYIVMDYIQGEAIDTYCNARDLSIEERLELFRTLCTAVHYVHQHLMVHGDLKCGNVLVTHDGCVKLLDFGIARLLSATPGLAAPATTGQTTFVAMTPEYASPEQVRGESIATTSDVYSLGVVLYKLLTGMLPYRSRTGYAYELANNICEQEPVRPSDTVERNNTVESVRARRRLRGDLDNIVLMALRKAPSQRYPSAEQFAEDIRRHLQGFPVNARGTSFGYLFTKFVKRNKLGVAAAATIVLSLMGGIVATSWQSYVAKRERARAEMHFNDVRRLANTFLFDVHDAIEELPGATQARQILVENSLRYLDGLAKESADDPSLMRDLAAAYEKVADVQGGFHSTNLGDAHGAQHNYEQALNLRKALLAQDPRNLEVRREMVRNLGKLSDLMWTSGDVPGALAHSHHVVKLAEALVKDTKGNATDLRNLANAKTNLGGQLLPKGHAQEGLAALREAATVYQMLLAKDPQDTRSSRNLALVYSRLAENLQINTQQYPEMLRMNRKAAELQMALLARDPHNAGLQRMLAYTQFRTAEVLLLQNHAAAALVELRPGYERLVALSAADPRDEEARIDAIFAHSEIASTFVALGEPKIALEHLQDALDLMTGLPTEEIDALTESGRIVAMMRFRLGETHLALASKSAESVARRIQLVQDARAWYAQSQQFTEKAAQELALSTYMQGMPEKIRARLAKCDGLLDQLRKARPAAAS